MTDPHINAPNRDKFTAKLPHPYASDSRSGRYGSAHEEQESPDVVEKRLEMYRRAAA